MRRITIFLTAYLPMQGGAELAVKDITDRLGDFDFDLICARLRRSFPKTEKIGNVKIYRVGFGSKIDKILMPFFGYLKVKKIYSRLEPASKKKFVIWGIMASWGSLAALVFKIFNPRVPFLLTLQEGDAEEYIKRGRWGLIGLSWRLLLKKADSVQVISNYLADMAKKFGYNGRIEIIPNGVDIKKIKNQILRIKGSIKNSKSNKNEKIIITVSRLVEKNGLEDLIDGFKLLIADCQFQVKLLILGSGPLEDKLKQQVENLDLKAKVNFLGDIPNVEVSEYLAIADIFVRPSLSEGLGTAFLEAMAAGIPVVGTRVGGITDFLRDRETGLFCELKNPRDIAYKINLLLIDEALRQKIIASSFKLIEGRYDWDKIGCQMRDILNQMGERKKILIATGLYPPDIGGPATYSKILKDELPKRGFGVEILSFGEVRHLPKIIRHFIYFFKVFIKGRRADVVFAQDPVSVGFPGALAAKILRKKFILKIVGDYAWEQNQIKKKKSKRRDKSEKFETLENFQKEKFDIITEFRRLMQKFVARKADRIITPSEYLKKIVADGWGVPAEKIKVIYNCMIGEGNADFLLDNQDKKYLLSIGRLVPWKGFDVLIEAVKDLPEGIELLIIGDGPEKNRLEEKVKKAGLENRVRLIGRVKHSEIGKYFKQAKIFILNTAYEGLSHVILEAMAYGAPAITTNIGGNPELIENGNNGILLEYDNKEQIKEAILRLWDNKDLRKKFIDNSYEKFKNFSLERMINSTIKVLEYENT